MLHTVQVALASSVDITQVVEEEGAQQTWDVGGSDLRSGDAVVLVGMGAESGVVGELVCEDGSGTWQVRWRATAGSAAGVPATTVDAAHLWKKGAVSDSIAEFYSSSTCLNVEACKELCGSFGSPSPEAEALALARLGWARKAFPVPSSRSILRSLACAFADTDPAAVWLLQHEQRIFDVQRETAAASSALEAIGVTSVVRALQQQTALAGRKEVRLGGYTAVARSGVSVSRRGMLEMLHDTRRAARARRAGSGCGEGSAVCDHCAASLDTSTEFSMDCCSEAGDLENAELCRSCGEAYYCSAACRAEAWPYHSMTCSGVSRSEVPGTEGATGGPGTDARPPAPVDVPAPSCMQYMHRARFVSHTTLCPYCKRKTRVGSQSYAYLISTSCLRRAVVVPTTCRDCHASFKPADLEETCGIYVFHECAALTVHALYLSQRPEGPCVFVCVLLRDRRVLFSLPAMHAIANSVRVARVGLQTAVESGLRDDLPGAYQFESPTERVELLRNAGRAVLAFFAIQLLHNPFHYKTACTSCSAAAVGQVAYAAYGGSSSCGSRCDACVHIQVIDGNAKDVSNLVGELVDWSKGYDDEFFGGPEGDDEREEHMDPHWAGRGAAGSSWLAPGGFWAAEWYSFCFLIDVAVSGSEGRLRRTLCYRPRPHWVPVSVCHANRRHSQYLYSFFGSASSLPEKVRALVRPEMALDAWTALIADPDIVVGSRGGVQGDQAAAFDKFIANMHAAASAGEGDTGVGGDGEASLGVALPGRPKRSRVLDYIRRLEGLGQKDKERFLLAMADVFARDPESCHTSEDSQRGKDAGLLGGVCMCKDAARTSESSRYGPCSASSHGPPPPSRAPPFLLIGLGVRGIPVWQALSS